MLRACSSPLALTVAGMLLFSACDKTRNVASVWSGGTVQVDGKGNEWSEVALEYFDDAEISWGMMNDADNLYLLFATWNGVLVRKLQRDGVTLWFSSTGEKTKRDFGVHLSGGMNPRSPPSAGDRPDGQPPDEERQARLDHEAIALEVELLNARGQEVAGPDGAGRSPSAASGCDGEVCLYEIAIPIRKAVATSLNTVPGEKIGIGVELNLPKRIQRSADSSGGGAGRHGGGGGHMGMGGGHMGMGGRGRGAGGPGDTEPGSQRPEDQGKDHSSHEKHKAPEFEKKEIWLSVTLATKPKE